MIEYQDLIGIPFKDGGRDTHGMDCWGVVKTLLERQGYRHIPDYCISAFETIAIQNELEQKRHIWRKLAFPVPGCVILLANGCTPLANHVGIVVDKRRFIHSYIRAGVCLSLLSRWKSHIIGYYLPPEVL